MRVQVVADKRDQRQIAVAAGRVEADQARQHLDRGDTSGGEGVFHGRQSIRVRGTGNRSGQNEHTTGRAVSFGPVRRLIGSQGLPW